jgi:hypothetical protein
MEMVSSGHWATKKSKPFKTWNVPCRAIKHTEAEQKQTQLRVNNNVNNYKMLHSMSNLYFTADFEGKSITLNLLPVFGAWGTLFNHKSISTDNREQKSLTEISWILTKVTSSELAILIIFPMKNKSVCVFMVAFGGSTIA